MVTISDWLMIFALIIGPILAVQIQKFIERRAEKEVRKKQIFSTLMATRATTLSPNHVEALNRIDIDFYDNMKVKEAWKLLLDNFANYPQEVNATDYSVKLDQCASKSSDLLIELLHEMACSLGYNFDKVHLKRSVYFPKGHVDLEMENDKMRKALLKIFTGETPLLVNVVDKPIK